MVLCAHEFKDTNGVIDSEDMRATSSTYGYGHTPDMVTKTVGKGSDYLLATRDANKEVLDAEASTIR
ncbi:hypothetical protein OH492_14915 [Vibrio chagasii]|nr:hypothetical protein [Vibrio chagasii]